MDREAQRAARQRTRDHIEKLEQRIKELSRGIPAERPTLEDLHTKTVELEGEIGRLREAIELLQSRHPVKPAGSRNHNCKETSC